MTDVLQGEFGCVRSDEAADGGGRGDRRTVELALKGCACGSRADAARLAGGRHVSFSCARRLRHVMPCSSPPMMRSRHRNVVVEDWEKDDWGGRLTHGESGPSVWLLCNVVFLLCGIWSKREGSVMV